MSIRECVDYVHVRGTCISTSMLAPSKLHVTVVHQFGLPNRHGINNAFLPMAMGAGMTSAIMNPVALPVKQAEIDAKKAEVLAAGMVIPADMDDEIFCRLFGLGSTKPRAGKEMEAIRAANFLFNRDPHGGAWIEFNKQAPKAGHEGRGRAGRTGGRRRR